MENKKIQVEVVYALPAEQVSVMVTVVPGSSIETAVLASGILEQFPHIDLHKQKIGVFAKARLLSDPVKEGDRIEIYRELLLEPKEARRARLRAKRV